MSNTVNFIRTEYKDYQGVSYGWRAYDDYESIYDNNNSSPMPEDDKEFFQMIEENGSASSLFDFISENEVDCYIDGTFYEYSEIKDWLK